MFTDPAAPATERAMALAVVRHVRDAILSGRLKPGDRIIERELSARMAISRTPVREGLKLLETEGLIAISRNRGAEVTVLTPDEALNLFEVATVLEAQAARRIAEAGSADVLAALDDLHDRMVFHYNRSQIGPYADLDMAVHDRIVSGCGNPELVAVHARIMLRARRGGYMAIMSPERWRESVAEHGALIEALRARDGDAAASAWAVHLHRSGQALAQAIAADIA